MKMVFVSNVCVRRFSCVLVLFLLVLCIGLCIHVDLTYWIVYRCSQTVDGRCCCIIVSNFTITIVVVDDNNVTIHLLLPHRS